MIIKQDASVETSTVKMEGAAGVTMGIPIGVGDGSLNMIMRLFSIAPGGHTPYHTHDYEHLVRVISGKGTVLDANGIAHELSAGHSVFVAPNEKHQFCNGGGEVFEFTCTIPNMDAKPADNCSASKGNC